MCPDSVQSVRTRNTVASTLGYKPSRSTDTTTAYSYTASRALACRLDLRSGCFERLLLEAPREEPELPGRGGVGGAIRSERRTGRAQEKEVNQASKGSVRSDPFLDDDRDPTCSPPWETCVSGRVRSGETRVSGVPGASAKHY